MQKIWYAFDMMIILDDASQFQPNKKKTQNETKMYSAENWLFWCIDIKLRARTKRIRRWPLCLSTRSVCQFMYWKIAFMKNLIALTLSLLNETNKKQMSNANWHWMTLLAQVKMGNWRKSSADRHDKCRKYCRYSSFFPCKISRNEH